MQVQKQQQFTEVIGLIKQAQFHAVQSVNIELINLYWNVGAYITRQLANAVWGEKTVDELADFIQSNQPDLKGFNRRGLYRMKQFYETYSSIQFVSPLMAQLQSFANKEDIITSSAMTQFRVDDIRESILAKVSWTHHLTLISRTKTVSCAMTDSDCNMSGMKRIIGIILGFIVIGFCLFWCSITIVAVFGRTFASMGGMIMLMIVVFAAFTAFGMVRYMFYADNVSESWAALPCALSALVLYASGMSVSFLMGSFFPEEVEYRSMDIEGYQWLPVMVFIPLFMLGTLRLANAIEQTALFKKMSPTPPPESPKRTTLVQFLRMHWLKDTVVAVIFYCVLTVSGFTLTACFPPMPVSEKHLSYEKFYRKSTFPKDGSDFCYWRTNSSFYCDFSISEENFLDWTQTQPDWEINAIQQGSPVTIDQYDSSESFMVNDGSIAARKQDANNRVVEKAVFDRNTNRVYYLFHIL